MPEYQSPHDEIIDAIPRGQGLKYLAHWPPVNIDFEDVVYTVETQGSTKSKFLLLFLKVNI